MPYKVSGSGKFFGSRKCAKTPPSLAMYFFMASVSTSMWELEPTIERCAGEDRFARSDFIQGRRSRARSAVLRALTCMFWSLLAVAVLLARCLLCYHYLYLAFLVPFWSDKRDHDEEKGKSKRQKTPNRYTYHPSSTAVYSVPMTPAFSITKSMPPFPARTFFTSSTSPTTEL